MMEKSLVPPPKSATSTVASCFSRRAKKKAAAYEGALRPEARPTAKAHADALGRVYDVGLELRGLDAQIS